MFWKNKKNKNGSGNGANSQTPAEDIQIARQALQAGEGSHAIQHLAWALSAEPLNQEARSLLEQAISSSPNPFKLVAWEKSPVPYPIVMIEAYIHVRQDSLDNAFGLVYQIYQAVPGLPFLPWVVEWATTNPRFNSLKPDTLAAFLSSLSSKVDDDLSPANKNLLEQLLPVLDTYRQNHPRHVMLTLFLSILNRKLGKLSEALALATQAYQLEPGYFTATVLGNAYREQGKIAEAVATFRQGLAFKPEDLAIRLDIGDTLCENGQIEEGLAAYQEVLSREPKHAWAYPSFLYYRGLLEPEGEWKKRLEYFAKDHPGNERAQSLVRQQLAYLADLPEPGDATVNIARQLSNQGGFKGLRLGVSSLESPSAYLALQLLQVEQSGGPPDFKVEVAEIQHPDPDPRLPRGEVDFVLWRYRGTVPEPNVAPPAPEVARLVAELAARPYEASSWWLKAEQSARQLGTAHLRDLLGVMLHPPARPAHLPIWVWLQRVQFAAAFIIARIDQGWENSLRRRMLLSLARGPLDWTVGAAIVALCLIVQKEQVGKAEIEALYLELFQNLPRPGGVPYEQALICCALYIQPSPALAQLARRSLADL
jgi:tetratricopeptide (TPR) repeat protein